MRYAIYARKSTEQTGVCDEERSVTRQVEHAKAYAAKKGWTVAGEHIYVDDGISGAEFANRPGFVRLMAALKPTPPFDILIMSEGSRLGRESIETAYALKQLTTAGVQVWLYLENKELTLDTPADKVLLSVAAFADELEREKARQRTHDAMLRKAKAGQVTGGRVYGYDNREVLAPGGKRLHVERVINPREAEVVRDIFGQCAAGKGFKKIAKELNRRGVPGPRSAWAPSSIREIMHRDLYRGDIVWNKVQKRDQWGKKKYKARPETEWVRVPVPELQIVPDELWEAAHDRLAGARGIYLRKTNGQLWGRPASGIESRYLLAGMAQCSWCGGSLIVVKSGGRKYKCANYHSRGTTVCPNGLLVSLEHTNQEVLRTLEQDILQPKVVEAALRKAIERLRPSEDTSQQDSSKADLAIVEAEIARLTQAIVEGGDIPSLVAAVKERERRRAYLQGELDAAEGLEKVDLGRIEEDLRDRLTDWQGLLQRQPMQARQILRKLLVGRLVFTPQESEVGGYYTFEGKVNLGRVLEGVVLSARGRGTPTGHQPF